MYLTGFTDEASPDIDMQLKAIQELGWHNFEARGIYGSNLAGITDAQFDDLCAKLEQTKISINCYGSGIANFGKNIKDSPETSYAEMRNAIPRMQKLGIKMVRIMSFAIPQEEKPNAMKLYFDEVVKRLKTLVSMAEDAGILCVHENCMNFGGMSFEHTLRLLDAIRSPAFKLVFDTGNPVFNDDVRGVPPYHKQSAWDFYRNVKDFIAYVHIKDGKMNGDKIVYTFAGDGDGDVVKIVSDLLKSGYDGGFSMEPHLIHVFHEAEASRSKEQIAYDNFVEYGRRFEKLPVDGTGKQVRDYRSE